jgi:hypothetical protein
MSRGTWLQIDLLYLLFLFGYDVQINKDYMFIDTQDLIQILDELWLFILFHIGEDLTQIHISFRWIKYKLSKTLYVK